MIVDANLLLYAVDEAAGRHAAARTWLEATLNGEVQVGLPWASLLAFVRIATHPRASERPLPADRAWEIVEGWLAAPTAWVPEPTPRHADLLGSLVRRYGLTGNLVPDAHLTDTDFARFDEIRWIDPLRATD